MWFSISVILPDHLITSAYAEGRCLRCLQERTGLCPSCILKARPFPFLDPLSELLTHLQMLYNLLSTRRHVGRIGLWYCEQILARKETRVQSYELRKKLADVSEQHLLDFVLSHIVAPAAIGMLWPPGN